MTPWDEAILAIRHVVQDHGDDGTKLGGPANVDGIQWFGRLLGWSWPRSYVETLSRHDGVLVQDAIILGFLQSIEIYLVLHDAWDGEVRYWPIASDGCGNNFAMELSGEDDSEEAPVVFFDMIESQDVPASQVADNYSEFVVGQMKKQCERVGCGGPTGMTPTM